MDGNKDEAIKCLQIGKEAIDNKDRSRAIKFINKARRLDPNLQIDPTLLASLSESQNPDSFDERQNPDEPKGIPSLRKRAPSSAASSGSGSGSGSSSTGNYTQEQISIVRQIKKQKDYYEILGIEKDCSADDVKKAYRKLSLKVHPDKNKAPGAEEAFKSVSKAFQCLSNEESRRKYNVTGTEEVDYERVARRRGHNQGFNGFYEADFDPDEIFRNFFYGGGPGGATTQFGGFSFGTGMPNVRTTTHHASSNSNLRAIIQILPILLVILLNFLPSNEPVFSLSRSYPYEYHVKTSSRGVDYYVKSEKFEQKYPPDTAERGRLEHQIEKDYYSVVSHNCRLEMQRRNWGLAQDTPHCDLLNKFNTVS